MARHDGVRLTAVRRFNLKFIADMQKMSTDAFLEQYISIFQCPQSASDLRINNGRLESEQGQYRYDISDDTIPLLFATNQDAQDFGTSDGNLPIPLPAYTSLDDTGALIDHVRKDVVARLLDEQIPWNAKILEIGCGIGQSANFLSVANRLVIGVDASYPHLRVAQEFKNTNNLHNAHFVQMNIFQPCFKPDSFDVVLLNTGRNPFNKPFEAFAASARLVKPGGYLVTRLFHSFTLMAKQPEYPISKHTLNEVFRWIRRTGLQFVNSIPKSNPFEPAFSETEQLFKAQKPGNRFERGLVDVGRLLTGRSEGGFFIIIAQK